MTERMHNVAKWELKTFSEFQKKLHTGDGKVTLRFQLEVKRVSWGVNVTEKVEGTDSENPDGHQVIYSINHKFDYLMWNYLQFEVPAVKVPEKFRGKVQICWTPNLFHNMIKEAHFREDSESIQRIDQVWLDVHAQNFIKGDFRKMYMAKAGNIRALTEWNDVLPRMSLKLPQSQWMYGKRRQIAFPLFLCRESSIDHQYLFNLSASSLLRVRARENSEDPWQYIDFQPKFVTGLKADGRLPTPEMFARYAMITDIEKQWIKDHGSKEIYYDDVVSIDEDTEYRYGDNPNLVLDTTYPCKAAFFHAENQRARGSRYMSNYTTDSEDHMEGWNPIVSAGLSYGSDKRVPHLPSDSFDFIEPFFGLDTIASEPGYNVMILSFDLPSVYGDVGSSLFSQKSPKLNIKLNKTVLYEDDGSYDDNADIMVSEIIKKKPSDDTTFKIRIRLVVQRRLEFTTEGKIKLTAARGEPL